MPLLEKAVQAAIYEKALKNHYIEILYIDFEDTGKSYLCQEETEISLQLCQQAQIFPPKLCAPLMTETVYTRKTRVFAALHDFSRKIFPEN